MDPAGGIRQRACPEHSCRRQGKWKGRRGIEASIGINICVVPYCLHQALSTNAELAESTNLAGIAAYCHRSCDLAPHSRCALCAAGVFLTVSQQPPGC